MSVFSAVVKNKVDMDKKPRVYFTCHPDDFDKYFPKICDDLFKTHDCIIYHTKDMAQTIIEEDIENDLGRCNLFVIPVTFKLLTTPSRARDTDLPYATKAHIPVLPILMEAGIDAFYAQPDRFGEMQYLNPYSEDLTEIPYEEKLKKYLDSVLISDELADRVRRVFGAYIFLSYRKKDRGYANELMRHIHDIPGCDRLAIWFDEYLTPGESFRYNIEKKLDESRLFVLLVTPRLLQKVIDEKGEEQDNFVIATELPLAQRKQKENGTDILPVEMEQTDHAALRAVRIGDPVNLGDVAFRTRVREAVPDITDTAGDDPEKVFLLGLAYLTGLDVEIDSSRAVALIEDAAQHSLVEAAVKLVDIYKNGITVPPCPNKAVVWQAHLVRLLEDLCRKQPCAANLDELLWAYVEKGDLYRVAKRITDAKQTYSETLELVCQYPQLFDEPPIQSGIVAVYTRLADLYRYDLHDTDMAAEFCEKSLELQQQIHAREQSVQSCRYLALCYQRLADLCRINMELEKAKTHLHTAIALLGELSETSERLKAARDIACCYERLGWIHRERGDITEAFTYCQKALEFRSSLNGIDETDENLRDLCVSYIQIGHLYKEGMDPEVAEKYYTHAVEIAERRHTLSGSADAVETQAIACDCLSKVLLDTGDFENAGIWAEKAVSLCLEIGENVETVSVLRCLSNAYESLVWVEEAGGDTAGRAGQYSRQILQLRTKIADMDRTSDSEQDLSVAYENMGRRCEMEGAFLDAASYYEKALELRTGILLATETPRAQRYLAITYDHIGDVCYATETYDMAMIYFKKACDLRLAALAVEETVDGLYELSVSYMKIGDCYMGFGRYDAAYANYEKMWAFSKYLTEQSQSPRIKRNKMIASSNLAYVLLKQNKLDKAAFTFWEAILESMELDAILGTAEAKVDCIKTLERAVEVYLAKNDPEGTARLFKMILHYGATLLECADTPDNRDLFAMSLLEAAKTLPDVYGTSVDTAIEIYQELCTAYPQERIYQRKLACAKALRQGGWLI